MALEQQIDQDLKSALLNHDALKVETLRGLKSVLLYAKVAAGTRDEAMPDDQIITLFAKEAKKRQESIDLYMQGGDNNRAQKERDEKAMIEVYLPKQLSEAEVVAIVESVIVRMGAENTAALGAVIGAVKQETNGAADGALIAKIVKERLTA